MAYLTTLARHAHWLNRIAKKQGNLPSLFFLTDQIRTPEPLSIVRNLPPATGVVLRHYDDVHRYALAQDLARECRKQRLPFLVAGNIGLARAVSADGLHLPEWQIFRPRAIPPNNSLRIVTASAHNLPALIWAGQLRVSAAFLSPVFATASHPKRPPLGVTKFAGLVTKSPLPVYALGGITDRNVIGLVKSGAAGIAGIGAFLSLEQEQS